VHAFFGVGKVQVIHHPPSASPLVPLNCPTTRVESLDEFVSLVDDSWKKKKKKKKKREINTLAQRAAHIIQVQCKHRYPGIFPLFLSQFLEGRGEFHRPEPFFCFLFFVCLFTG